jgi:hypothetical protein
MTIIIRVHLPRATVNIILIQSKVTYIDLLRRYVQTYTLNVIK